MKNLHRISLVISMLIAVIMPFVLRSSKVYNIEPEMWKALGLDPGASSYTEQYKGDMENRIDQAALTHPELFTDDFVAEVRARHGVSGGGSAPSQPATSTPATSQGTGKADKGKTAAKVTAYFTDMYGHVIGSSQITAGTTIGESQFVKDVPDCDGKKFDSWDYDGRELYHDTIVRANYK